MTKTKAPERFSSEKSVKAIDPPKRGADPLIVRHAEDKFFGVRIMPPTLDGDVKRVWFVRLGQRREKLGLVGTMTMADARKAADEARSAHVNSRGTGLSDWTMEQMWNWYKAAEGAGWSADTLGNYERLIKNHLAKSIWSTKASKLSGSQLETVFTAIREKARKRNLKRGVEGDGSAVVAAVGRLLHAILARAARYNKIRSNPMAPIAEDYIVAAPARTRRLAPKDFPKFYGFLQQRAHPAARDYLLTDLFLALRRSVMGSLRWTQLHADLDDLDKWTLLVPPEMRGNKAKLPFAQPLPRWLVETVFKPRLESPTKHPEWIIESNKKKGKPYHSIRGLMDALAEETGIRLSDHDVRRTSGTLYQSATKDPLIVARLLTHNLRASAPGIDETTAGYIITAPEDLRVAGNKAVEMFLQLVSGSESAVKAYDEARATILELDQQKRARRLVA